MQYMIRLAFLNRDPGRRARGRHWRSRRSQKRSIHECAKHSHRSQLAYFTLPGGSPLAKGTVCSPQISTSLRTR